MGHYYSEMGDPYDAGRIKAHQAFVKRIEKRGAEATFYEYMRELRSESENMALTLTQRRLIESITALYLNEK